MSVYIFGGFMFIMAAVAAVLFKRRFEIVLPCCIFYIILILYFSGLVSSFRPGIYFVWATLPVIGILYLIKSKKNIWMDLKTYVLTPGFFFMLITYVAFLPCILKMHLNTWDEFTHWGTVIKNFWYFHDFANLENATTFLKTYPPAASLFAYFAQCFGNHYVECKSYGAYIFLFLALMCPYFLMIQKKNDWFKAILLGFCCVLMPTLMGERVYDILYVDAFLGLETALLFITYLFYKDEKWKTITIGMTSAILCLTKASGAGLAGIALFILTIAELSQRVNRTKSENKWGILSLTALAGGLLFGKYSWEIYLKLTKTLYYWETSNVNITNMWTLATGQGAEYQYETIGNFFHAATVQAFTDSVIPMSCLGWLITLLLFCILIEIMTKNVKERKKIRICAWGSVVGIVPYACSMLLLYLFTFSAEEALAVASFDRYMSTYFGTVIVVHIVILYYCLPEKCRWGTIAIAVAVALTSHLPIYKAIITATPTRFMVYNNRPLDEAYQRMKVEILDQCGKDDVKVYFVYPDDSGFWYYVCLYGITPWHVQDVQIYGNGSFQPDKIKEDWETELREGNFTHVLMNGSSEDFEERFSDMFQEKEYDGLYEIIDVDGQMKLKKVWDIEYGVVNSRT